MAYDKKFQVRVLNYLAALISDFNVYKNFLNNAKKDLKIAQQNDKDLEKWFYFSISPQLRVKKDELEEKFARMPLEIPAFRKTLLNQGSLALSEKAEVRDAIIWYRDTLEEFNVPIKSAPKGTDEWLRKK